MLILCKPTLRQHEDAENDRTRGNEKADEPETLRKDRGVM